MSPDAFGFSLKRRVCLCELIPDGLWRLSAADLDGLQTPDLPGRFSCVEFCRMKDRKRLFTAKTSFQASDSNRKNLERFRCDLDPKIVIEQPGLSIESGRTSPRDSA